MIVYRTDVAIESKPPKEIYDWWLDLTHERYTRWHKEHLYWYWDKDGARGELGAKFKFGERIDSHEIRFRGKIAELRESELIRLEHSYLPVNTTFVLTPTNGGCILHYETAIGFEGLLGRLFDPFIRLFYSEDGFGRSLLRHVHEELIAIP